MNDQIQLAGCVITDDYGRILLIHRDRGESSHWELPGGKVEKNERPEDAAVRELAEELGIKVRVLKALGSEAFEEGDKTYRYHWFQAVIESGELRLLETETFDDFDYIDLEDMPSLALSTNMLILYPKIYSGEIALEP